MVKKADFELYRYAKKDVELRAIKAPWKNAKKGDVATIQCGRKIYRKRIANIHHGGLARIFMDINYKRIFPQASNIFEAVRLTRKRIPLEQQYVAFELEDFV